MLIGAEKTTLSNSATIMPGPNSPKSPPDWPDGQEEFAFATAAKSAPCSIYFFSLRKVSSLSIKICRAVALAIVVPG